MYNKSVVAISKFLSTIEDWLTNIPTVCVEEDRLALFVLIIYLFIFTRGQVERTKERIIM